MSCVARDITRQYFQNKELKRLEEQLRHAEKMEAMGTLAGGIAHEFNNILGAIFGYTEVALMNAAEGKNGTYELEQVLEAAERARTMIRQVLTFSRKTRYELTPLDLNREVEHAASMLQKTLPRMVTIEHVLEEPLDTILGDTARLQQLLLNLGSNAADAMPQGGTLTFQTQNVTLLPEHPRSHFEVPPGEYVLLTISDTGIGMDQETVQQIFDPFFTTKEVGKGTGLGLSTVFGIVKGHGGHISCSSQPGKGTDFTVYFPAARETTMEPREPREHEGATQEAPGGNETILVVDDEEAILKVARAVLTRSGYKTLLANNGEEAISFYRNRGADIDLVLLDVSMPGMGGYGCMQKLKEMDPDVRVVVTSGYTGGKQLREMIETGADGFVAKPFGRVELLTKVRNALDRRA